MMKAVIVLGFGVMFVFLGMLQGAFGSQRICGPVLRKTLELVCPNGVGGYKTKRSFPSLEDEYNVGNNEDEDFQFGMDLFPFMSSEEANSLTKTRRRRHGIAHECCDKPCTLSEMKSYCLPPF